MVAHTRCNEVVLVGIAPIDQKLSHGIAHRCLFDVLSECPPTEIPHFFKAAVRTIEEGYVLRHPLPRFCVRDGLHDILVLHRIEVVDVVFVVIIFQEGGGVDG